MPVGATQGSGPPLSTSLEPEAARLTAGTLLKRTCLP